MIGALSPASTGRITLSRRPSHRRRQSERLGHVAEWVAAALLVVKGYRILALRHRNRSGEIDLIAVRGRRIAFVEVKARATRDAAEIAVASAQTRRIESAVEAWIRRHPRYRDYDVGLDAVVVTRGLFAVHMPDALQG
jgi:putative endonuclease